MLLWKQFQAKTYSNIICTRTTHIGNWIWNLHYDILSPTKGGDFMGEDSMTKEEMQRFLIKESQRGSTEIEAYRNLMEILGIEYTKDKE